MADNKPWGRAYALEEREGNDREGRELAPLWHNIGTVWTTENGNLKFQMRVSPVIWEDPHEPRTIVLRQADNDDDRDGRGNDNRDDNRNNQRGRGRGNRR